ncbi:MAG TPA: sugar phosphate isomerase/epimerase family protein, partial [Candidatus Kapabacteria bacterium]|nr:sugar phosphate isomerase/epimerase family protein [Candidatus Kapabacteria bacterium]
MKLGLSSYTFGWAVGARGQEAPRPLNEQGLLDKCGEHGVRLLQIGDNLPLHTFDEGRLDQLGKRAKKEGIELEIGMRGLTSERFLTYARIARELDGKLLRVVIDDAGFHPSPAEVIELLREVMPPSEGLTVGIENHDRFAGATLREIIEAVGNDRLGVCLDTANSLGAGEGLDTVLRELGPLTVNLHIKDFAIARVSHLMGFTVEGRPAGQGFLNVGGLLEQLSQVGRCKTAVLELWTPPEVRLEETIAKEAAWAGQSMAFLKSFF